MKNMLVTKCLVVSLGSLVAMSAVQAAELVDLRTEGRKALNSVSLSTTNGTSTELKAIQSSESKGKVHTRYQQYHKGVPIFGHQVIKHQAKSKALTAAKFNGYLVQNIDKDVADNQPLYNEDEALTLAKGEFEKKLARSTGKLDARVYSLESVKLHYYLDKDDKAHLAYVVSFFTDKKAGSDPAQPIYILDAKSKAVLQTWNDLKFSRIGVGPGGNEKVGKYQHGEQDLPKLDVARSGKHCSMKSRNVVTYNLKADNPESPFKYECVDEEGNPLAQESDPVNGAYSPLNDAHAFGGVVFDMYKDWYARAPLKDILSLRVHYGTNYENAFYINGTMTFGDGASFFYPLVSLDVVAHEVSHGFTEQNSGLLYYGQSGGMNEAFSDMAGKAAEYYFFGENNWAIGIDITKSYLPLRDMMDPPQDGRSIGDARDFENQNVHYTSGVYNRAFAVLATTHGWDTKKAFDLFVKANMNYWTPSTDFADGAWGVVQAALDEAKSPSAVIQAFRTVGIECGNGDACVVMPDTNA